MANSIDPPLDIDPATGGPLDNYEHYQLLTQTAARISERVHIPITIEAASYWVGGRQQADYYDIMLPWSTTGPMNFWFAYGWLEGYGAHRAPNLHKRDRVMTEKVCTGCAHPPHVGRVCGRPITETICDDVGIFAPPSYLKRTIIVKTCPCGYVPGECGHDKGLESHSDPRVLICIDCGADVYDLFNPGSRKTP